MRVLIAEDEELALERIEGMLRSIDAHIEIVATTDSKQELKRILLEEADLDLLILDIQLSDGKSLELFDELEINTPTVFTTAYDEYALEAFKHLSLGYLLKPVSQKDLKSTINKLDQLKSTDKEAEIHFEAINSFRTKLLLKLGARYVYRNVSDASYFYADDKDVYMISKSDGRKYPIDSSLDKLEQSLDPSDFFRISRKFLVHIDTIAELKSLTNLRYEIRSDHVLLHRLLVSRSKVKDFRNWLNR